MIDHAQARALALADIQRPSPGAAREGPPEDGGFVILDDETIERPWGWMFFYSTRRFVETGDFLYALAGNAPLIVERATGRVLVTGTAEAPETYLQRYEAFGDAHLRPGRVVVVERVEGEARVATAARELHRRRGASLVLCKQGLEAVARGEPFTIEAADVAEAAEMLVVLRANGFVARQLPERE